MVSGAAVRAGTARAAVFAIGAVVLLTSCMEPPNPPVNGYRMEDGELVVLMPLCPGASVQAAEVVVRVKGEGRGDGFETLWAATGPRTKEARAGAFTVGSARSFATETKPVARALPNAYYVSVRYAADDRGTVEHDDGEVDVSRLRSATLGPDEYMTERGKVMTRAQIGEQLACGRASGAPTPTP
ncbi:hypothetical protein [Streptomyces sp. NPDC060198]|uniref:hypothetical protein n=1 Tax=Streptomyces sp. NPDC060198 TaxID=3347070 RepID=UPI003669F2B5